MTSKTTVIQHRGTEHSLTVTYSNLEIVNLQAKDETFWMDVEFDQLTSLFWPFAESNYSANQSG